MRAFLILLLCLMLPLQGLAAAPAADPCPMAQDHHGDDAPDDCCNDADAADEDGRPCKSGEECPAGSFSLPVRALSTAAVAVADLRVTMTSRLPLAFSPADVWRPPSEG